MTYHWAQHVLLLCSLAISGSHGRISGLPQVGLTGTARHELESFTVRAESKLLYPGDIAKVEIMVFAEEQLYHDAVSAAQSQIDAIIDALRAQQEGPLPRPEWTTDEAQVWPPRPWRASDFDEEDSRSRSYAVQLPLSATFYQIHVLDQFVRNLTSTDIIQSITWTLSDDAKATARQSLRLNAVADARGALVDYTPMFDAPYRMTHFREVEGFQVNDGAEYWPRPKLQRAGDEKTLQPAMMTACMTAEATFEVAL